VFGGDTAYTHAFKKRSDKRIDIAIMPIGAYDPFRFQHCTPEEALKMALDMHTKIFIPIHRGTFRLSREKISAPIERLKKALPDYPIIL
jgi:L-ascorbate metabolism protein UlaG (beta-lactamase superfamily)